METNFIPSDDKIVRKETYEGIIKSVGKHEVMVSVFREDGTYIEEVFPLNLFKGKRPEVDDDVKYHVWQLKTGEFGGYFENLGYIPTKLSKEDQKEVERIFRKWEKGMQGIPEDFISTY